MDVWMEREGKWKYIHYGMKKTGQGCMTHLATCCCVFWSVLQEWMRLISNQRNVEIDISSALADVPFVVRTPSVYEGQYFPIMKSNEMLKNFTIILDTKQTGIPGPTNDQVTYQSYSTRTIVRCWCYVLCVMCYCYCLATLILCYASITTQRNATQSSPVQPSPVHRAAFPVTVLRIPMVLRTPYGVSLSVIVT